MYRYFPLASLQLLVSLTVMILIRVRTSTLEAIDIFMRRQATKSFFSALSLQGRINKEIVRLTTELED